MENATKGLMIAGAILIAIVLIGIGVTLVNSANETVNSGLSQMDAMEINSFNAKFESYEGLRISGSNVRALINTYNTTNLQSQSEELLPENGITLMSGDDVIFQAGTDVAEYDSASVEAFRRKINSGKTYTVELSQGKAGLINIIKIIDPNDSKPTTGTI